MRIPSLLLLVAVVASNAAAAQPAITLEPYFAPLEYMIGHCWRAKFKNGQQDVQCYRALYGGKLVEATHVVEGSQPRYEGVSIFSWDATNKRLRFHYFTSTGAVAEGHFANDAKGVLIPERHVGEDGTVTEMETRYQREGDTAYRVVTSEKTATGWVERMNLLYQREPQPAPKAAP
ncbi:hypothetical protein [Lysobacter sp. CFH 32150]|uniref:hypothetical protein n=1 Tax=Lysobacter sp. CFH 32150 TaxID=2927128 RepID=UPI001FA7525C|nr:hypothetical protein [Lysobacter sp. CFH 32150]MCI4568553.1 hypothetical protein [Lysobacter sp. CFH 32150]